MKNLIFILGLVVILSSCGNTASEEELVLATDSTACFVDTTVCDSMGIVPVEVADTIK